MNNQYANHKQLRPFDLKQDAEGLPHEIAKGITA